jgi:peroxiredoxin
MKKTAVFLFALILFAAAYSFNCFSLPNKSTDFLLNDLTGKPVSSTVYKGKTVLMVFFRAECPGCQQELPQIEQIYEKYRSKKFDVLGVNVNEDANVVRSFAKDNKLSFTVILDDAGALAAAYQIKFIPRIVLLDRSGKIRFSSYGIPMKDLEKEIKKVLK